MKYLIIGISIVICSYFLGNTAIEMYKTHKLLALDFAVESNLKNKALEVYVLKSVLFELENHDKQKGIYYLNDFIRRQDKFLRTAIEDDRISPEAINDIEHYLNKEPKSID